jgi:DGQHR domain-containing protein
MTTSKKQMATKAASFPAVPIVQNEQRFYFTTIPVSSLFPYCFVARRNEDPKTGFQRRLSETRAEDIAKYLHDGRGSIPTNIVLSAQEGAGLAYNSRSKLLSYDKLPGSFLVLDGQHRLWGYEICRERYGYELRVPVSIYTGLTRADEARLFIDINTTQVGVPSALLLDIKQVAEIESSSEQVLRGLFDDLNSDVKSPLRKLLSPSKSVVGKISRVTFNKALMPVIRANVWMNTSKKSQYQLLLNYICAVVDIIDGTSLLTRAAFFESVFEVFDDVIQTTLAKRNNAKQASIKEVLAPLKDVDFAEASAKTRATKSTYLELIKNALRQSISISDSMV